MKKGYKTIGRKSKKSLEIRGPENNKWNESEGTNKYGIYSKGRVGNKLKL